MCPEISNTIITEISKTKFKQILIFLSKRGDVLDSQSPTHPYGHACPFGSRDRAMRTNMSFWTGSPHSVHLDVEPPPAHGHACLFGHIWTLFLFCGHYCTSRASASLCGRHICVPASEQTIPCESEAPGAPAAQDSDFLRAHLHLRGTDQAPFLPVLPRPLATSCCFA